MSKTNAREYLVVNFHGLGAPDVPIPDDERPYWCEADTYHQILDSIVRANQVHGSPIVITFDDGNASDLTVGLPGLIERNLKAEFFVCAGRIGQEGYLGEQDLRTLSAAGMSVGSHGWGHTDWTAADDSTLHQEIDGALMRLTEVLGEDVQSVAIPFGRYNGHVVRSLRKKRLRRIYTSDGGRAKNTAGLITREAYETWWDADTVSRFLTAPVSPYKRLRTAVGRAIRQTR